MTYGKIVTAVTLDFFLQVFPGGLWDSEKKVYKEEKCVNVKYEGRIQIKYFLYHIADKYELHALQNLKIEFSQHLKTLHYCKYH